MLLALLLFVVCIGAATGLTYVVTHWIAGDRLWLVIDLLLGLLFGIPLFLVTLVIVLRRLRRRHKF